ncbi:MAG: hypothetical protein M5R36_06095 [Deltaproteobacteria bacterium]|nr:hypothetical protein [Deltaproteobacteria bacterium]
MVPSGDLTIENLAVEPVGGDVVRISCDAYWPPNPNGFRLRRADVGPDDPAPVTGGSATARIQVGGGAPEEATLTGDQNGHFEGLFTMTRIGLPHQAEIEAGALFDEYGNANGATVGPVNFPDWN